MEDTWKTFFKGKRREIIFLSASGFTIFILILFLGFIYEGGEVYVPENFMSLREYAFDLSADTARYSNKINETYEQIAAKDSIGDYNAALAIMEDNQKSRERIQDRFTRLAEVLAEMADEVDSITPSELRKIGKNIISTNIRMVEGLIAYHNLNEELVGAIRAKLTGEEAPDIQAIINTINVKVYEINEVSQEYQGYIQQFDQIVQESQEKELKEVFEANSEEAGGAPGGEPEGE